MDKIAEYRAAGTLVKYSLIAVFLSCPFGGGSS